ncbi:Rv2175c family DNA-binding protein [Kocuria gwangalliensis]|uniref:Rv2175c family DNA-binding protein n=1 Tax=Kocuria gwangalliensis TaxID=501592 RepID=A0ABP8WH01_9MICC|nr:Rv2175c family DNA-binding protein [Kocuria sp.]
MNLTANRGKVLSVNHSSEISAETFAELDSLVGEWTYLPDIAQALDIQITKVHRMMDQGEFLEVRRPSDGVRVVPAEFMAEGQPLNALKGTISVLRDARYTDEEAIRWLFTDDESLPGRPVDALREGRKTEVRRRAQALGW